VDTRGLVALAGRPTTEKIRVIAHTQQVVRVDRESKSPLPTAAARKVLSCVKGALRRSRAVVLEDYNKGVLTPEVIRGTLAEARRRRVISTVDPKFQNFFEYRGATLVKPNLKEAREALGAGAAGPSDVGSIGRRLVGRLHCGAVMITQGEKGVALIERGKAVHTIPTMAREVYDVSGAGDTVIATLTLALAAGAGLLESAALANYAAGIEVAKLGVATVSAQELLDRLLED
jgi:D-beta-D-heptose 7-phosphate kinase/D-beta-D-heptose 1-phosphate adenosyltransferase